MIDKELFLGVNFFNLSWEESLLFATGAEVSTWLIFLGITVFVFGRITLLAGVARSLANTALAWIGVVADELLVIACSTSHIALFFKSY